MITTTTMPAEYLHSSRCLAHALICAVENLRDSHSATAAGALAFRLALQDGTPLAWADEYLASGTADCLCHSWDIDQRAGNGKWRAVCACGWQGMPYETPTGATRAAMTHAERAVADAWALVTA